MTKATFLRLLDTPISEKGTRLRQQIADLNATRPTTDVFPADSAAFAAIPGSPFAYWASYELRELFKTYPLVGSKGRKIKQGLASADDFRFIRAWWEVLHATMSFDSQPVVKDWVDFAKGGKYSPYYCDIDLKVNWTNQGDEISANINSATGRPYSNIWMLKDTAINYFLRPGLTWPRRSQKGLSVRAMPAGCIFADKGPTVFVDGDTNIELLALLAIMNSYPFQRFVQMQMVFGSYEVGVIQRTPLPQNMDEFQSELSGHALIGYKLVRQSSLMDETTHVFSLPTLLRASNVSLAEHLQTLAHSESERRNTLAVLQAQIDSRVAELYGAPELAEPTEQKIENIDPSTLSEGEEPLADEEEDEGQGASLLSDPYSLVSDLLMWCVGVAFGRWDVRYALNPETLPALPEPFDPLPICSPGMLQGKDGLPLNEAPKSYPLPIASHGFLVDDPDRPRDDIITAVRRVLSLLWGANSEAIENEACQILQVPDLRTWFRDPRGFFAWHIRRYSKSRRKAPIYWLIQSAKKNYAVWLYYPRLNPDSLFFVAREYADAKLNLENARLEDIQNNLNSLSGANRKVQERKLAVQTALVVELKSYIKTLDAAALLQIKPDLNDGVLLNIAPLRELIPWKEPSHAWDELLRGKYAWSHIATQLRQKGLVKGA